MQAKCGAAPGRGHRPARALRRALPLRDEVAAGAGEAEADRPDRGRARRGAACRPPHARLRVPEARAQRPDGRRGRGLRPRRGLRSRCSTDAELVLERGEHVALIGPNGSGKSTLLEAIVGRPRSAGIGHGVELAYFSQHEVELDERGSVLECAMGATGLQRPQAQALLGRFLFSGWDDHEKPVVALSGGERRRLALALVVASGANFLVLDEPTNHLDLESREALEAALEAFPGTVLLVSHDRAVLDAVAERIVAVEDGRLRSYDGGWADYVRIRGDESAPATGRRRRSARRSRDSEKVRPRPSELERDRGVDPGARDGARGARAAAGGRLGRTPRRWRRTRPRARSCSSCSSAGSSSSKQPRPSRPRSAARRSPHPRRRRSGATTCACAGSACRGSRDRVRPCSRRRRWSGKPSASNALRHGQPGRIVGPESRREDDGAETSRARHSPATTRRTAPAPGAAARDRDHARAPRTGRRAGGSASSPQATLSARSSANWACAALRSDEASRKRDARGRGGPGDGGRGRRRGPVARTFANRRASGPGSVSTVASRKPDLDAATRPGRDRPSRRGNHGARPQREDDLPACVVQLLGELAARLAAADDEHGPIRETRRRRGSRPPSAAARPAGSVSAADGRCGRRYVPVATTSASRGQVAGRGPQHETIADARRRRPRRLRVQARRRRIARGALTISSRGMNPSGSGPS